MFIELMKGNKRKEGKEKKTQNSPLLPSPNSPPPKKQQGASRYEATAWETPSQRAICKEPMHYFPFVNLLESILGRFIFCKSPKLSEKTAAIAFDSPISSAQRIHSSNETSRTGSPVSTLR